MYALIAVAFRYRTCLPSMNMVRAWHFLPKNKCIGVSHHDCNQVESKARHRIIVTIRSFYHVLHPCSLTSTTVRICFDPHTSGLLQLLNTELNIFQSVAQTQELHFQPSHGRGWDSAAEQ